jgi:hypothetical protein
MASIYVRFGFEDRNGYLDSLAEDYLIPKESVYALANLLGPEEDFDGLLTSLEDAAPTREAPLHYSSNE